MSGLFQTIEIGKRALLSQQIAMQTTGHNIANVGTSGYTRQRVMMQATNPTHMTVGSLGTGVHVTDVSHIRDLFLGEQFREENKSLGQWQYKSKIMGQIESLFNEPNDNTISDLLHQFWSSWAELAKDAQGGNPRKAIITTTTQLINTFHEVAGQLEKLRESIDRDLVNMTADINRLASEIARLNHQVQVRELDGKKANDLRDARDVLIDELSHLIDVNVYEQGNGGVIVFLGAMALVDGPRPVELKTVVVNKGGAVDHELHLGNYSYPIKNYKGQLAGLMEARDDLIPHYIAQLDQLAEKLITEVNRVHSSGYTMDGETGINFFDPNFTTAASIRISADLLNEPAGIVAAAEYDPDDPDAFLNDNRIAIQIEELRNQKVVISHSTTLNDFYNGIVGELGVETHEATSFTANYEVLVNNIKNSRESVQGVSLDEEMANLIKYQHAYDAAARVITAMDAALDTVINGMGIVGR
jgi:flagellar hook-associated protein 1 FlgK